MQIVIDISEPLYNYALGLPNKFTLNSYGVYPMLTDIAFAVKGGQPLPDDAIIIDAKEQSDYVFVEKAKYNDLVEAASKALTDRIKKSLHEGGTDDSEDIPMEYFESGGC